MSSRKSVVNILWFTGQPLLLNIISVPATAYIIFRLGPLHYGQWAVGASLVAATGFLADLGLRTLFVRTLSQSPSNGAEALGEQMGLRGLLSLLAGIGAMALCLGLRYPPVILVCVAINVGAQVTSALAYGLVDVLQSLHRFKALAAVNLAAGLAMTAASVIAIAGGAGPVGLSVTYLVGPTISLPLLALIVSREFPIRVRWSIRRYSELLRQARALTTKQFVLALQGHVEQLLVPKLVGVSAFGYFAAGSMLANRLVVVPDGIATVFYPQIARDSERDAGNVDLLVVQLCKLSLAVCVPIALLLTFLARPVAQILFPHHSEICISIIRITIWSIPLLGVSYPMGISLQAAGRYNEAARRSLIGSLCGLVLSITLVCQFHLIGACWSLVARSAIGILVLAPLFARTFPAVTAQLPVARIAVSAALMACVLWFSTVLHLPIWLTVTGGSIVSLAGYAGALMGLGVIKTAHASQLLQGGIKTAHASQLLPGVEEMSICVDPPTISVIIPAYNAAQCVGHAIESALAQTYAPIEIIVVDDGSQDDTSHVVARYSPQVCLIRQQNGGPNSARNHAIRESRGEWVALLDADDSWLPNKLERQVSYLQDDQIGIVHCFSELRPKQDILDRITFEMLWTENCICSSSVLIRRDALLQIGGFDEDLNLIGAEDYNLWLRMAASKWEIVTCPEILMRYTPAPNNLTSQTARVIRGEIINIDKLQLEKLVSPSQANQKRRAVLEEYGRALLYIRQVPDARAVLLRSLRLQPSFRGMCWCVASFLPDPLLNWRRTRRLRHESDIRNQS